MLTGLDGKGGPILKTDGPWSLFTPALETGVDNRLSVRITT